ncbi:MAG: cation diffusion facilitator family transporter [Tildeniella nuda ZEHNDER 1965/U140]|jgi:cobalt-zinc-cadmium efflux system protein|nr:cation diffusion facilitator family transporter [Tildeniella nuda ZEHNDER 1965/U140]
MTHHHAGHDHHHGHNHTGHAHHHAPANFSRAFAIGLTLNLGFVCLEVIFGYLANSVALLADAGHNLSDVLGLVLAWGASVLARRQPSSRYTYGWRRSSILAAFLNAIFLLVVTGGLAWEAIQRFSKPDAVQGEIVIIVAAIGIVINTVTALMFMSGRQQDLNLRAAFMHMAADAVVSFGVVLAGIGILVTHWLWLDPAFSLVISALIIVGTWQLLKDSFNLAIDAVPEAIDERAVKAYLAERPGVEQVHDLHIWGMSTTETALTAHLVIPDGHPGDAFLVHLCEALQAQFGIAHTTIQIELSSSACTCTLAPLTDHH